MSNTFHFYGDFRCFSFFFENAYFWTHMHIHLSTQLRVAVALVNCGIMAKFLNLLWAKNLLENPLESPNDVTHLRRYVKRVARFSFNAAFNCNSIFPQREPHSTEYRKQMKTEVARWVELENLLLPNDAHRCKCSATTSECSLFRPLKGTGNSRTSLFG